MVEGFAPYDYAWKTPGWSVQHPAYNGVADSYVEPGLPDTVTYVRLYGKFLDWETGRPLEGVLRIRTTSPMTHVPSGSQVLPGLMRFRFTKGTFSVMLPATDDPDLSPEFLYEAVLTVAGHRQEFKFSLPTDELEVNILDKIPSPTGSIDIISNDTDDISLGLVPDTLIVNLITGGDFVTTLENSVNWDEDAEVQLEFDNGPTWTAALFNKDATFTIDKSIANGIAEGTGVRLVVSLNGDDEVWAVGKVVRHG